MNMNRKAQLQRKLSMKSVPQPPPGLRERISNDIPKHLGRRSWFSGSGGAMLRIAASIVLLITAVTVTIYHLEPGEEPRLPTRVQQPRADSGVMAPSEPADVGIATASSSQTSETSLAPAEELLLAKAEGARRAIEIQQNREQRAESPQAEDSLDAAGFEPMRRLEASRSEVGVAAHDMVTREPAVQSAPVASAGAATRGSARPLVASPVHPAPAAAPPPPPAAPPALAAETSVTDEAPDRSAAGERKEANSVRGRAMAGAMAQPVSADGQDAGVRRLIETLDRGSRPAVADHEISQIVSYFARQEPRSSTASGQLDLEMSVPAVDPAGRLAILRVSLDPDPSAGVMARIEIDVDPRVASVERIGGGPPTTTRPVRAGEVSALYRLILRPEVSPASRVATIRVHYLSDTGKELQTSESSVTASAVRSWEETSLRHRVATLAAAWGESLTGRTRTAARIADLAAALARQNPGHAPAQELARVTRAWADLVGRETQPQP